MMQSEKMGSNAPIVLAAISTSAETKGCTSEGETEGLSMHLACSGSCIQVRAVRQGEPTKAPKSPAAMKGGNRGGRDSAHPVGIQAVRESDETL